LKTWVEKGRNLEAELFDNIAVLIQSIVVVRLIVRNMKFARLPGRHIARVAGIAGQNSEPGL
jgi:hypothetical protein